MRKTLIIIAMLIIGNAAFAVEGPGTMTFSPTQIPARPAPFPPVQLDSAQRYLQQCEQVNTNLQLERLNNTLRMQNYNGYNGAKIQNPYVTYPNNYGY